MPARVKLTVVEGEPLGREYVFGGGTVGALGRSKDCLIQLPTDLIHINVSRHHCMLYIDPPHLRVRDLGSRNGTFVNGKPIGKRPRDRSAESACGLLFAPQELHEGDELRVGDTVFRVTAAVWDEDGRSPFDSGVREAVFGLAAGGGP
jgi:pSer/pThr/pTyr-binding forkhead associated (FHA) protein